MTRWDEQVDPFDEEGFDDDWSQAILAQGAAVKFLPIMLYSRLKVNRLKRCELTLACTPLSMLNYKKC